MTEKVWKLTGYNRHPSMNDSLREDVLPLLAGEQQLCAASVPCATGVESLALAIELEKNGVDYHLTGLDVDDEAIQAARDGIYEIDPVNGQIIGDPFTDYSYQWGNLSPIDRERFFNQISGNKRRYIQPKQRIKLRTAFRLQGIEDLPEGRFDLVVCFNFLRYLTDERFADDLPTLNEVTRRLFESHRGLGVVLIDPTSAKSGQVTDSLKSQGYAQLSGAAYVRT